MPAGRTSGVLAVAILLLAACQATTGAVYREPGLVTGKPGMNVYPGGDPGETSPLGRPYPIAPPLVPHRVDDVAIDRENNGCLDCHLTGEEVAPGHRATKVPPSHFRNAHTGGEAGAVARRDSAQGRRRARHSADAVVTAGGECSNAAEDDARRGVAARLKAVGDA